jgi:hypothetical protein
MEGTAAEAAGAAATVPATAREMINPLVRDFTLIAFSQSIGCAV